MHVLRVLHECISSQGGEDVKKVSNPPPQCYMYMYVEYIAPSGEAVAIIVLPALDKLVR